MSRGAKVAIAALAVLLAALLFVSISLSREKSEAVARAERSDEVAEDAVERFEAADSTARFWRDSTSRADSAAAVRQRELDRLRAEAESDAEEAEEATVVAGGELDELVGMIDRPELRTAVVEKLAEERAGWGRQVEAQARLAAVAEEERDEARARIVVRDSTIRSQADALEEARTSIAELTVARDDWRSAALAGRPFLAFLDELSKPVRTAADLALAGALYYAADKLEPGGGKFTAGGFLLARVAF